MHRSGSILEYTLVVVPQQVEFAVTDVAQSRRSPRCIVLRQSELLNVVRYTGSYVENNESTTGQYITGLLPPCF